MASNNDYYTKGEGDYLYLRKAELSDLDLLFEWANDEITRSNAFSTELISYSDHKLWFEHMMNDPTEIQYILMNNDMLCGQIRLNLNGDDAEIDYSISKQLRGNGYGKEIIRLVKSTVRNEYPQVKKLIGRVKPSNVASLYCFLKNGFEERYKQLELSMKDDREIAKTKVGGAKVEVLFLTNNVNSLDLYDWISERCDAELYSGRLDEDLLELFSPKLVVSYNYIYMIAKKCIDYVDERIINMHISFLPYNRGFSPNIWSFIDDTPKGVTIHILSEGLDEGDILFQNKCIFNENEETFETTYTKLNDMIVNLFKDNWDCIITGEYQKIRTKQSGKGSYHCIADLKKLRNDIPFEWDDNISFFLNKYRQKKAELEVN